MEFATFYVGPGLPAHLQACLRSWVDYGHSLDVYTYDEKVTLPPGVGRRDANEIIPSSALYTYQQGLGRGSVSAFSNEFRYRLCDARRVTWVDTDVLCLRADWPERDYQFAWQSGQREEVNTAVFSAPPGSELIRRSLQRIASTDLATAQFGQLGPVPFTKTLFELDLVDRASDHLDFYPIEFTECHYFLDPALRETTEDRIANSYAVHLWNEVWSRARIPTFLRPPVGSFLETVLERHGIVVPVEAHLANISALSFVDPGAVVPRGDYDDLSNWAASLEVELRSVREWASGLERELTLRQIRPSLAARIRQAISKGRS